MNGDPFTESELLDIVSHELKTPMNAILGHLSLLRDESLGILSAKQEHGLKKIETNARNSLQFIDNILGLAKFTAGKMSVYKETCNLRGIVEDVTEALGSLAQEKKLRLTYEVPNDLCIPTDSSKLKQVLMNLIGNSIKFTSKGGVFVEIKRLTDRPVVQIAVQDTGIGIPEEDISSLGQPFQQLHNPSKGVDSGTGLGLFICKKFVELLGGSFQIHSTPGTGSTFIITLPEEIPGKEPPAEPAPQGRVLLVDDDHDIVEGLQRVLERAGYTTDIAEDGEQALAKISSQKPDILFLDLMMPQVNGFDVLKEIETRKLLEGLRIFVFTAKHLTPQQTEYLRQRVEKIVQKGSLSPVETVSLLREKSAV